MKRQSKTLVMLTPAFPASKMETSWVTTQQLFVRAFREQFPSLQIFILSFYYPDSHGAYDWHGMQVTSFNGVKGGNRGVKRIFFWRDVWKKLRVLHRDNDLMGLFSFWCGECALIGHYFGKRYGLPHYCWLCGQDARETNKLVKFIRPRPEELIAMSDFLVREFHRNHRIRPQHMIPNAIDPSMYPVPGTQQRDIDLLGVGSLSRLKQYDVFVQIVASLRSMFPCIRATICGEGEARDEIQQLIKAHQLDEHVSLPGLTPHREVLSLMQRTKILLHTSNYEGFGVVCLEALYAGAHVISFCRPMEQDIPHWHIAGSPEEMMQKAKEILRDPATSYTPVLPYTMNNTVRSVMELFTPRIIRQNISYHDAAAADYNAVMDSHQPNQLIRQRVKEKFCGLAPLGKVLDFGGGTGLDLGWLTAAGYEVIFCEPSAGMRDQAIGYENKVLRSNSVTFLKEGQTDFLTWGHTPPFPGKVDAILSDFGPVNYIPDIRQLFTALAGVIRPGGYFLLLVLHLPFSKRWKWHRRNAMASLLFRRTFQMYIPYKDHRQMVFVHTEKEITKAAAPWFRHGGTELLAEHDFTLIHLIRNEETD